MLFKCVMRKKIGFVEYQLRIFISTKKKRKKCYILFKIRPRSESLHIKTCWPDMNATKTKLKIKKLLSVQGLCTSHLAHKTNPQNIKIKYKCWSQS